MFFKVFSVFPAVFKVFFSSFLSVSQKKKKKRKRKKKGHSYFFQSEVHLTRYNLSFNPRYTLLGTISISIRDSEIHLARYNLSFNPRYNLLGILSNSIRDTPC